MSEMQKKMSEMENLKKELQNRELSLEHTETEGPVLAQKQQENYEDKSSMTNERDDRKELQETFKVERDQLKEYIKKIEAAVSYALFLYSLNVPLETTE